MRKNDKNDRRRRQRRKVKLRVFKVWLGVFLFVENDPTTITIMGNGSKIHFVYGDDESFCCEFYF
jgi:hypothetical protein